MDANNKRIAKNTIVLYIRMIVLMLIGFYTTRIILEGLGVENYGIYNVVGGLVSMFTIVSSSLSNSISRYITYGLGQGDMARLKNIYGASMMIQIVICIIVVILVETMGIWFLNYKLNIPQERMFAANIVFQMSVFSFVLGLLNVPNDAAIIAHEKMTAFAYMGILDGVFKLFIAYAVMYAETDKLILYGALLLLQGIITRIIYWVYCRIKFEECRYTIVKDKSLYKEIFGFSGWNFIGMTAVLFSNQGVNIILNMFFGPFVNGARGIGMQVNSILSRFTNTFTTAINPQITKSYAAGDFKRTFNLMVKGAKFSYFLFLIISFPIILETPKALEIWLHQEPQFSVAFARLAIILTLSNTISYPLVTAQMATGKIKSAQIGIGLTNFLNLPISYLILKLGASPPSVMIVAIILSQLCFFVRIFFLKRVMIFSFKKYIQDVYFRVILTTLLSIPVPYFIYIIMPPSITRFIIILIISFLVSLIMIRYIGCNKTERKYISEIIIKFRTSLFYNCNNIIKSLFKLKTIK